MKNYKAIVIALLCGVAIFSIFKYFLSLKEKYDLLNSINDLKTQVEGLKSENQNILESLNEEKRLKGKLVQKNSELKNILKASKNKITDLYAELIEAEADVEQLDSEASVLKAENAALRDENNASKLKLAQLSQEKENLKARLNSLPELKKAIRELKKKMRLARAKEVKKQVASLEQIIGNRGFLIKDGKPTYTAKVKIEVVPALEEHP